MKCRWKLPLILILILISIMCMYIKSSMMQRDGFEIGREPTFMTHDETMHFFEADQDHYFHGLTAPDLFARGSANTVQYIVTSVNATRSFNPLEKFKITNSVKQADAFFHDLANTVHGLDVRIILNIPWRFAKTDGQAYEQGFPHTRSNIIFVATSFSAMDDMTMTTTMIHEKIHVYQRMYPEIVKDYVRNTGFKRHGLRKLYPNIRANPDLDEWVYSHDDKLCMYLYKTSTPTNIEDTTIIGDGTEHPYEHMAYFVASLYSASMV
jgi:hypothetical protein